MLCFLTYLIFKNLWNNHRHVVLCTSLKSRRERRGWIPFSFCGAVTSAIQIILISTAASPKWNLICLLWCLSPDRQPPVFAVQQFCALESGSFLLAKRYCEHWNGILELCGMNYNVEPSGALTFTWDSVPLMQTTSSFWMVKTSLVSFRQTS